MYCDEKIESLPSVIAIMNQVKVIINLNHNLASES